MSAREELHESMCGSCCGNYARGECESVNRVIDAYAHELAEQQRAMVADRPEGDLMRTFFRGAANVIDPAVTK